MDGKLKECSKKVVWVDEIGGELVEVWSCQRDKFASFCRKFKPPGKGGGTAERKDGKAERLAFKLGQEL